MKNIVKNPYFVEEKIGISVERLYRRDITSGLLDDFSSSTSSSSSSRGVHCATREEVIEAFNILVRRLEEIEVKNLRTFLILLQIKMKLPEIPLKFLPGTLLFNDKKSQVNFEDVKRFERILLTFKPKRSMLSISHTDSGLVVWETVRLLFLLDPLTAECFLVQNAKDLTKEVLGRMMVFFGQPLLDLVLGTVIPPPPFAQDGMEAPTLPTTVPTGSVPSVYLPFYFQRQFLSTTISELATFLEHVKRYEDLLPLLQFSHLVSTTSFFFFLIFFCSSSLTSL
jgi:hypothetical protein